MKEFEKIEWETTKSKYLPECVIDFLCWIFPSTLKFKADKEIWRTSWFSSELK